MVTLLIRGVTMEYRSPKALSDLGIGMDIEEDTPKSVLDHFKSMSPPVSSHTVRPGDSLWAIAKKYGTTVREIARLNPNIKDINRIHPGDEIDIPVKQQEEIPLRSFDSGIDYEALSNAPTDNVPSAEDDAILPSVPEELIPLFKGLGAAGLAAGAPKAIGALARMAPAPLQTVGQVGNNMVRGAVPWAGAKQAMNNIRPITGSQGAAKAIMNSGPMQPGQQMSRGLGAMNPQRQLAQQGRALNNLGPQTYPGKITPPVRNEAMHQSIQQMMNKVAGKTDPRSQMLSDIIKSTRREPTPDDLVREGSRPTFSDVPFQELLKRVGYRK